MLGPLLDNSPFVVKVLSPALHPVLSHVEEAEQALR